MRAPPKAPTNGIYLDASVLTSVGVLLVQWYRLWDTSNRYLVKTLRPGLMGHSAEGTCSNHTFIPASHTGMAWRGAL